MKEYLKVIWKDLKWQMESTDWPAMGAIGVTALVATPILIMLFWDVGVVVYLLLGRSLDSIDAIMAGGMLTTILTLFLIGIVLNIRDYLKGVKERIQWRKDLEERESS